MSLLPVAVCALLSLSLPPPLPAPSMLLPLLLPFLQAPGRMRAAAGIKRSLGFLTGVEQDRNQGPQRDSDAARHLTQNLLCAVPQINALAMQQTLCEFTFCKPASG